MENKRPLQLPFFSQREETFAEDDILCLLNIYIIGFNI